MAVIYRKAALDKQSSPEQLDSMIKIISPGFWLATIGGFIIVLAILIWSIVGRIPVDVQTSGIYMSRDGIHTMYSKTTGIVKEIYVGKGSVVSQNQIIARYSTDKAIEDVSLLYDRKKKVEEVTLDSTDDFATADNSSLIDIKSQLLTISANLTGNQKMLSMRKQQLAKQRQATDDAKAAMQLAHNMYYATMNTGVDTKEQLEYQTASSKLSSETSLYETAKTTLTNFKAQSDEKMHQLETTIDSLNTQIEAATDEETKKELNTKLTEAQASLNQLRSQESELKEAVNKHGDSLGGAENWFYTTAQAYIDAEKLRLANQTYANQQSDNYNLALSDYNTQLSQLRTLEDAVAQLEVQVSSEDVGIDNQYEALENQFESAKATAIDELEMQIRTANEQLEQTEIRSTLEGCIVDLNITVGSPVQQGSAVCRISQTKHGISMSAGDGTAVSTGDSTIASDNVVICYVPAADGRKIKEGMEVKVYPSTINKEEYGHMKANVTEVAEYVTSQEEVMNQLGDEALVNSFFSKGAVVEVVCDLEKDPSTASGYAWSSKKGSEVTIDPGTIVATDTVIEDKAPISLVIPYIKEKLTVKSEEGSKSSGGGGS